MARLQTAPPPASQQPSGPEARSDQRYRQLSPALHEYSRPGCVGERRKRLRARLVLGYLPVVKHIARRYSGRGEPADDLEQVGAVGLIKALERFEPDRDVDFLSYLVPSVSGEMRRHFRDRTWATQVPRRLKDLQVPLRTAIAELSAAEGRAPRPSELARHLGLPRDEVIQALTARQAYAPTSIDSTATGSDLPLSDVLGGEDPALETAQYRDELRQAVDELPPRERKILILRFFDDLTQSQIAQRVGLSQMHVSRLLSQTLARMRERLDVAPAAAG